MSGCVDGLVASSRFDLQRNVETPRRNGGVMGGYVDALVAVSRFRSCRNADTRANTWIKRLSRDKRIDRNKISRESRD